MPPSQHFVALQQLSGTVDWPGRTRRRRRWRRHEKRREGVLTYQAELSSELQEALRFQPPHPRTLTAGSREEPSLSGGRHLEAMTGWREDPDVRGRSKARWM